MTEEEIIEDRKNQYGSYEQFVIEMASIMNILKQRRGEDGEITTQDTDNFFLVLKLLRLQTSEDEDSLIDLANYARLIRERRFGDINV
jgi:hypothetical protein